MAPVESWLPLTVSVAVAVPPLPARVAFPRLALPNRKETDPVGEVEPVEALTLAVSTVNAEVAIVAGVAARGGPADKGAAGPPAILRQDTLLHGKTPFRTVRHPSAHPYLPRTSKCALMRACRRNACAGS